MPRAKKKYEPSLPKTGVSGLVKKEMARVFFDRPQIESDIWKERPVGIKEFCDDYLFEPLFPEQLVLCEAIFGPNPLVWDFQYKHFVAFWGKGSGKDRTAAKVFAYTAYKLACMKDPWTFFHQGRDESFDLVNVSINARQAKNVFFKKLKNVTQNCINPKTGKNWFEERGAHLNQGEDIQVVEIRLPCGVTCHSLNSDAYTGEGLNIFIAVVDEKGGMKGGKGVDLTENLQQSSDSRYPKYGKVIDISFKYHHNDDMDVTYHKAKNDKTAFVSRKATWEVNPFTKREDFEKHYRRNKNKAQMTYECAGGETGGDAIPDKQVIYDSVTYKDIQNPIIGKVSSTRNIFGIRFHEWFQGDPTKLYTCAFDLAKGKNTGDDVGFALGHPEMVFPKIRGRMKDSNWSLDQINGIENTPKRGVAIDLMLQIKALDVGEIRFADLRRFVLNVLRDTLHFNIVYITYDGYQSLESVQEFNYAGIVAEQRSVDKSNDSYENWIDLMGDRCIMAYPNAVYVREAEELMIDPETGKIDHPALSYKRSVTEGKDKGSKDVTDAVVQVTMNCMEKIGIGGGFVA